MNERYAIDPAAISNSKDLRYLLERFGPHAGRYMSTLPAAWIEEVERRAQSWAPLEAERGKTLLRRAKEERRILREKLVSSWRTERTWLENVRPLLITRPVSIEQAVVGDEERIPDGAQRTVCLADFEVPPVADERIDATVAEYRRVCSVLAQFSHELFLVDPYLDPTNRDHSDVLGALWKDACEGPCRRIVLWARSDRVLEGRSAVTVPDIERALQRCAPTSKGRRVPKLEMLLVSDRGAPEKMHARYLLSIHGGVRLERGFQCFRTSKVDVSPVATPALLKQLLSIYKDGGHGFQVEHTIVIGAG